MARHGESLADTAKLQVRPGEFCRAAYAANSVSIKFATEWICLCVHSVSVLLHLLRRLLHRVARRGPNANDIVTSA